MNNDTLVTNIKQEIQRLQEILEKNAWIDERWENEMEGRIDSLHWVLEQMSDTNTNN